MRFSLEKPAAGRPGPHARAPGGVTETSAGNDFGASAGAIETGSQTAPRA